MFTLARSASSRVGLVSECTPLGGTGGTGVSPVAILKNNVDTGETPQDGAGILPVHLWLN